MKIVFVILHYLAEEETYRSIASIKDRVDTEDYRILVVDNASPDGSGERIREAFREDDFVKVISNEENLGFSRGNNAGIDYARSNWDPDFIVLMNNDVFLLDRDTVSQIQEEYDRSHFAVLGPMIYTRDGKCNVNPVRTTLPGISTVQYDLQVYRSKRLCHYLHLGWLEKRVRAFRTARRGKTYGNFLDRQEQVQLHGCFMVFSREYFSHFHGLDPRTFLYREELILYKHLMEHGLKNVYLPHIHVYHLEDAATDASEKRARRKEKIYIDHQLQALHVLEQVYREYEVSRGCIKKTPKRRQLDKRNRVRYR